MNGYDKMFELWRGVSLEITAFKKEVAKIGLSAESGISIRFYYVSGKVVRKIVLNLSIYRRVGLIWAITYREQQQLTTLIQAYEVLMTAHSIRSNVIKMRSSHLTVCSNGTRIMSTEIRILTSGTVQQTLNCWFFCFFCFFRRGTYAVAFAANLIVLNLPNLHTCRPNIKTIVYREQQQQQLTTLIQVCGSVCDR